MQVYAAVEPHARLEWLEKAATGGNPVAMVLYAKEVHERGDSEEVYLHEREGMRRIRQEAQAGNPGACAFMGVAAEDESEQGGWFLRAAKKGYWPLVVSQIHGDLAAALGSLGQSGDAPPWMANLDQALVPRLIDQAARAGDPSGVVLKAMSQNMAGEGEELEEALAWRYLMSKLMGEGDEALQRTMDLGANPEKVGRLLPQIKKRARP